MPKQKSNRITLQRKSAYFGAIVLEKRAEKNYRETHKTCQPVQLRQKGTWLI